jgi:hypothetical protein
LANDKQKTEEELIEDFVTQCDPLEGKDRLVQMIDARTNAHYCECHVLGSVILKFGTTDVPLDDDQPEYRANRDLEENSVAFHQMKEDAKRKRSFSNIVAEWKNDADSPLKIIGGQHRFEAIRYAVEGGADVYHGVKVYFDLDMQQRLDVQLISNTNIGISGDLIDRMHETSKGSELRVWCQKVGLLEHGQQFADAYARGGPISVRIARTFITNYFLGSKIDSKEFPKVATNPIVFKSGDSAEGWEKVKRDNPEWWKDPDLQTAAVEFSELVKAQRNAFISKGKKPKIDQPEKALNLAILAAWAFVAGVLHNNSVRLERHFALKNTKGRDPLNADELAKGRHGLDPNNYRGLGYRTDPQERGRFAELFFNLAETGMGITKSSVDIAIKQYHAKEGQLALEEAKAKAGIS